jgi:type I restriction enzyme, S subunit
MGEWRDAILGDLIELKRGYDLPQQDRRPGNIPIVSSSGVTDKHVEAKIRGPGVVTGRYGTLGQVFYINEDFWPLNTTLYVCNFKGNDPRFISYFLRLLDFLKYSDKAAVPGLNRNHLHQAPIYYPPDLHEQRAIAHVLGTLDDKIELNQRLNETLESMERLLFKSWFVDFDPVLTKAEGRDPKLPKAIAEFFPDSYEESELGTIPNGWKIRELDKIACVTMGSSPDGQSYNAVGIGIPLINGPVEFGEYFPLKSKWTTSPTMVSLPGDIIFCVRGSTTGRWVIADDSYCLGRGVCSIRPEKVPRTFLYRLIQYELGRLLSKTTGSVFPSLSASDIRGFSVLVPGEKAVQAFARYAEPLTRRRESNVMSSLTLTALRDTLLPKLISGELRLKQAEKLVEAVV